MSRHVRTLYLAWKDGNPEDRREIERHLGECVACRRYYDEMDRLLDPGLLSELPKLAPDPFLPERIAALAMMRKRDDAQRLPNRLSLSLQGAAFVAAVVTGILIGMGLTEERPAENVEEIIALYREAVHQEDIPFDFETVLEQSEMEAE